MVELIEVLILLFQLLILGGQLYLSRKMNQQELRRNKGYFLICKTNIPHVAEGEKHYRDYFDLTDALNFYVTGADDVLVLSNEIHVDAHTIRDIDNFIPVFFTRDERFRQMDVSIPLTDEERNKKSIAISMELTLQNTVGYQYIESIKMNFKKEDKHENWWQLTQFNLSLQDK